MRFIKLTLAIITITMFIASCNSTQTDDVSYTNPAQNEIVENEIIADENPYFARENLDLQRVGSLLEESDNAEDFEYRLNADNGINNLDLNGDGYTDYLSVSEFDNRSDNQRGFTIFDRFGPDEIQEIARIILDRNSYDDPGARVLLTGNEQLYGDDYNYETNWLDKALGIANWAFGDRNDYYESPYDYENYPNDYEPYQVVETPVYRSRVEQYYPQPDFVQIVNPTINRIQIISQYKDRSADEIYAGLAKPTKKQKKFKENNPNLPEFIPVEKGKFKNNNEFDKRRERNEVKLEKRGKRNKDKFEKRGKQSKEKFEIRNDEIRYKPEKVKREKVRPNKIDKFERQIMKQNKPEKSQRKMMKQNKPEKFERQMIKQNKPDKADKKADKGQNRGGGKGNGKGNGGGKKGKN